MRRRVLEYEYDCCQTADSMFNRRKTHPHTHTPTQLLGYEYWRSDDGAAVHRATPAPWQGATAVPPPGPPGRARRLAGLSRLGDVAHALAWKVAHLACHRATPQCTGSERTAGWLLSGEGDRGA